MRTPSLTQEECFTALDLGYILKNEHGFTTKLVKNKQTITNKKRIRKRPRSYAYKFDYKTWRISGKVSFLTQFVNKMYKVTNWVYGNNINYKLSRMFGEDYKENCKKRR